MNLGWLMKFIVSVFVFRVDFFPGSNLSTFAITQLASLSAMTSRSLTLEHNSAASCQSPKQRNIVLVSVYVSQLSTFFIFLFFTLFTFHFSDYFLFFFNSPIVEYFYWITTDDRSNFDSLAL